MPKSQLDNYGLDDLTADLDEPEGRQITPKDQAIFDELDAITAPADEPAPVVAEFAKKPWALEPVPASLADLDEALADLDLDAPDLDADEPAPVVAPGRRALIEKTRDELKSDAMRNGRKGQKYKAQQRKEYAERIAATEGRDVRSYQKNPTPDRVRDQNRARKQAQRANRTPAQIAADRKRDAERKRLARKAAKDREAAAMEAQALF